MKKVYISLLILGLFLPELSKAVTINADLGTANTIAVQSAAVSQPNNIQSNIIFIRTRNASALVAGSYINQQISKEVNLQVNSNNLIPGSGNNSVLVSSQIQLQSNRSQGVYNFIGGVQDTPPMNGLSYQEPDSFRTHARTPSEEGSISLSSSNSNIIECNGTICTPKQSGTVQITVIFNNTILSQCPEGRYWDNKQGAQYTGFGQGSFQQNLINYTAPGEPYYIQSNYVLSQPPGGWLQYFAPYATSYSPNNNLLCERGTTEVELYNDIIQYIPLFSNWPVYSALPGSEFYSNKQNKIGYSYTYDSITYNITVIVPNEAPKVDTVKGEGVGYTDAKITWNYSDKDNDAQTLYRVQIARDLAFNDIIIDSGLQNGAGSIYDTSLDNTYKNLLRPGIDYYARVKATDNNSIHNINSQPWVNGAPFRTQSYPQANINFNVIDSNGGETIAGDGIQFTWSITNPIGVQSCNASTTASTTGGTDAGNGIWTGNKAVSESPNTENAILALSQLNRTYNFTINCIPKTGGNAIQPVTVSLNTIGREALVTLSSNISTDLKQGDFVNISRTIVNREVLTGCSNTVTGGPVAAGGNFISDSTTNDLISPPSREQIDPNIRSNATYIFTSTCSAIDGPSRSSSITVTVRPRPSISCNLQNKVVAENNNIIKLNLIGDSTWSGPYEWRVKRGIGTDLIYSNSALNNTVDLNYSDAINLGLGKYDIKAQLNAGGINSDEATCGSINSLGNRTIREVAK